MVSRASSPGVRGLRTTSRERGEVRCLQLGVFSNACAWGAVDAAARPARLAGTSLTRQWSHRTGVKQQRAVARSPARVVDLDP